MGLTAIRLYSDWTQHWYSLLQQCLKVDLHPLKGVYAFLARLSSYCTRSWHNTLNQRLCISSASQWESPVDRAKSIAEQTMTYSLSYDISCLCFFHCWALVAVLDGYTVGTTWELLSLLRDARSLSGEENVWCKRNAWRHKLSSPRVVNLVSRLVIHEVPGSSARWRLGRFVFVDQQNSQVELRNRRNSTIYIPSSRLHLLFFFLPCDTHRHCPNLDITWHAQNNAFCSNTYPRIYTTLNFLSGLPSATCNCIIMLTFRM